MKKTLLLIIWFLSFGSTTEAFLWEDLGFNLYSSIDEWFEELELKQYEYELSWQWESIKDTVNRILKEEWIWECMKWELSSTDIAKIANGDIPTLVKNMEQTPECQGKNWEINNTTLINIIKVISEFKDISENKAKEKTSQINRLSRVWIYSDGSIENSPFDLIKDLQDIDHIIFASKANYEWEELLSDEDLINCITWKEKCFDSGDDITDIGPEEPEILKEIKEKIKDGIQIPEGNTKTEKKTEPESNYLCIDDINNNSGLNSNTLNNIIDEINSESTANSSWFWLWIEIPKIEVPNQVDFETNDNMSISSYTEINDPWPCYDFFCITVEFITYQHQLLIWWENISIEYLINRSNKHLKKFAATSLIPAKMSTNNFELWLKDLNLPDIFHMWFVITKKPVPILDVQSWNKRATGKQGEWLEFSKKNLLEEYYNNLWLDYSRSNDLEIFAKKDLEWKTILDSWELDAVKVREKLSEQYQEMKKTKKNDIIKTQIAQQGKSEELKDFEEQFIELQLFSESMNDYVNTIHFLIKEMVKIPQT